MIKRDDLYISRFTCLLLFLGGLRDIVQDIIVALPTPLGRWFLWVLVGLVDCGFECYSCALGNNLVVESLLPAVEVDFWGGEITLPPLEAFLSLLAKAVEIPRAPTYGVVSISSYHCLIIFWTLPSLVMVASLHIT